MEQSEYSASISNTKMLLTNHKTSENVLACVNVQRYQIL